MLANAVGQLPLCRLTPRIRQQAGSYQFAFAFGFVASVRACVNPRPVLDRGVGARMLSSAFACTAGVGYSMRVMTVASLPMKAGPTSIRRSRLAGECVVSGTFISADGSRFASKPAPTNSRSPLDSWRRCVRMFLHVRSWIAASVHTCVNPRPGLDRGIGARMLSSAFACTAGVGYSMRVMTVAALPMKAGPTSIRRSRLAGECIVSGTFISADGSRFASKPAPANSRSPLDAWRRCVRVLIHVRVWIVASVREC